MSRGTNQSLGEYIDHKSPLFVEIEIRESNITTWVVSKINKVQRNTDEKTLHSIEETDREYKHQVV